MVGDEGNAVAEEGKASSIAKRIQSAMQLVQRLVAKDTVAGVASVSEDTRASRYHRVNCSGRGRPQSSDLPAPPHGAEVKVEMYRRNWMTAYTAWRKGLLEAKKTRACPWHLTQSSGVLWTWYIDAASWRPQRSSRGASTALQKRPSVFWGMACPVLERHRS